MILEELGIVRKANPHRDEAGHYATEDLQHKNYGHLHPKDEKKGLSSEEKDRATGTFRTAVNGLPKSWRNRFRVKSQGPHDDGHEWKVQIVVTEFPYGHDFSEAGVRTTDVKNFNTAMKKFQKILPGWAVSQVPGQTMLSIIAPRTK